MFRNKLQASLFIQKPSLRLQTKDWVPNRKEAQGMMTFRFRVRQLVVYLGVDLNVVALLVGWRPSASSEISQKINLRRCVMDRSQCFTELNEKTNQRAWVWSTELQD